MKPAICFALICSSTLLFCCKKEKEKKPYVPIQLCANISRDIDTIKKYIPGKWKWDESKLFASQLGEYIYSTPNTEGYNLTLKISGDTAKFYKNSVPDSTFRYEITHESDFTGVPEDTAPVIVYYSFFTGLYRNYLRIGLCERYLVTEQSYNSDVGSDTIWERF